MAGGLSRKAGLPWGLSSVVSRGCCYGEAVFCLGHQEDDEHFSVGGAGAGVPPWGLTYHWTAAAQSTQGEAGWAERSLLLAAFREGGSPGADTCLQTIHHGWQRRESSPPHPTASCLGVVWRVRGLVSHVLPQESLGLRGEEY